MLLMEAVALNPEMWAHLWMLYSLFWLNSEDKVELETAVTLSQLFSGCVYLYIFNMSRAVCPNSHLQIENIKTVTKTQ